MRLVLVEDDAQIAGALRSALVRRGMRLDWLPNGVEALAKVDGYDALLLDLGLPDVNGFELCRALRSSSDLAIVVVSAKGQVKDRILALRAGADDYLVKPFDVDELIARLIAVLRRRSAGRKERFEEMYTEDVSIDVPRHSVSVAGSPIELSRKEFRLLMFIVAADGKVCAREDLIDKVWGEPWPGANRSLDVHVGSLRTKLGRPGLIVTVRGIGYRLRGRVTLRRRPFGRGERLAPAEADD